MGFWEELSSSTGSPTGTAVVEDPYARAVRLYEMELTNAAASAEARRADPRLFGDAEADIQREVIAPAMDFGSAALAPFQRTGRAGSRSPARPIAPIIRGSASSGYFSVDPVTGQTKEIREPTSKAQQVSQLDLAKYRSAQRVLSDIISRPDARAAAQATVNEIDQKYSSPETAVQSGPAPAQGGGSVGFFNSMEDELSGRNFGFQAGGAAPLPIQQQQSLSFPGMMPGFGGDLSSFTSPQAIQPAPSGIRVLNVRRKQ